MENKQFLVKIPYDGWIRTVIWAGDEDEAYVKADEKVFYSYDIDFNKSDTKDIEVEEV